MLEHSQRPRTPRSIHRIQSLPDEMQVHHIINSTAEQIAELKAGVEAMRESVTSSVDAFLAGDTSGAQLKEQLRQTSGVQLSASSEVLEELRAVPEGRQQIQEELMGSFNSEVCAQSCAVRPSLRLWLAPAKA